MSYLGEFAIFICGEFEMIGFPFGPVERRAHPKSWAARQRGRLAMVISVAHFEIEKRRAYTISAVRLMNNSIC